MGNQEEQDKELNAIGVITNALKGLTHEETQRILSYVASRYDVSPAPAKSHSDRINTPPDNQREFNYIHELFAAANPQNGVDNVLVACYWFKEVLGENEIEASQVNSELKNLGYPSTNITRDFDSLMSRTPKPIFQTKKQGTSQQARKKYALTFEGVKAVKLMIENKRIQQISDSIS